MIFSVQLLTLLFPDVVNRAPPAAQTVSQTQNQVGTESWIIGRSSISDVYALMNTEVGSVTSYIEYNNLSKAAAVDLNHLSVSKTDQLQILIEMENFLKNPNFI